MHHSIYILLIVVSSIILSGCKTGKNDLVVLSAPAGSLYTSINKEGTTVIPNGRLLTPSGKNLVVAPHPFGLALSGDGEIAVTANSGIQPLSISIIRNLTSAPEIRQVPPGYSNNSGVLESVFMGLAISPDNRTVYVAAGQDNSILVFDLLTGNKIDSVDCSVSSDGEKFPDGYIGDMILSHDGTHLFAVDQTNFRLIIVDTKKMQVINSVPVGRYPFGVALSHDEKKAYVANVGMFQYSKIGKIEEKSEFNKALYFPAFAYNTEEMKNGIITDSLVIPGLGDPNNDKAFSVWAISIEDLNNLKVTSRIKTENLVGQMVEGIPAVGGSSPNSLVATSDWVFVSNGNNDNITVINTRTDSVVKEIYLKPDDAVKHFRGVIPFGLAVSPDEKQLFVAEAGINAIGVIDLPSFRVAGHIPTGWFPSKLKITPDGKNIIVTNAKGFGSGPNGGKEFKEGGEGTYIGNLMKGTVSIIRIPTEKDLQAGYPFRESYMVDNDLAVGRIVEFLSHTPYWKSMAIVITEDDAQNGVDHIDAHRSVLIVVSPYVKREYVSKIHYSFGSLFKTFWNILGLPYLNQYDAGATDLSDMFTGVPDFTTYTVLPPDIRIFDPQKALSTLDEKFDWNSLKESPQLDDPREMIKDQKEKAEYRIEDQKK